MEDEFGIKVDLKEVKPRILTHFKVLFEVEEYFI